MLAAQVDIAQGTKKPSARITGHDGLFLIVIKTTRFAGDENSFARLAGRDDAKCCRKDGHLYACLAGGAGHEFIVIELRRWQGRETARTKDGGAVRGHLRTTRVSQMWSCSARF